MVNTLGQYSPSRGSRKASAQEIAELRRNMSKVPIIQEKADTYHAQQSHQADAELTGQLTNHRTPIIETVTEKDTPYTNTKKSPLFRRWWRSIIDKISSVR